MEDIKIFRLKNTDLKKGREYIFQIDKMDRIISVELERKKTPRSKVKIIFSKWSYQTFKERSFEQIEDIDIYLGTYTQDIKNSLKLIEFTYKKQLETNYEDLKIDERYGYSEITTITKKLKKLLKELTEE